ncbi:hypothetical protein ACMC5O_001643 [Sphingomonas sediminicola]|jgi:hypothetical protein|uniref:hypothetical protein n=1 Tax=Sphingomonas sediminicola TaxID=386874 RepID=UPI003CF11C6D
MPANRENATADFRRAIKLIIVTGTVFSIGALLYLRSTGELSFHMVLATIGGVFLSILLGCGLFAAAFFSDKSGHDEMVTDATKHSGE